MDPVAESGFDIAAVYRRAGIPAGDGNIDDTCRRDRLTREQIIGTFGFSDHRFACGREPFLAATGILTSSPPIGIVIGERLQPVVTTAATTEIGLGSTTPASRVGMIERNVMIEIGGNGRSPAPGRPTPTINSTDKSSQPSTGPIPRLRLTRSRIRGPHELTGFRTNLLGAGNRQRLVIIAMLALGMTALHTVLIPTRAIGMSAGRVVLIPVGAIRVNGVRAVTALPANVGGVTGRTLPMINGSGA